MSLLESLPPVLQERVRVLAASPPAPGTGPVLVWLRSTGRGHDNPAVDVGIEAARRLGVSVFVYQGISERTPFACDRTHHFLLGGATEAHEELRARGLATALHVERPGHRGRHVEAMAAHCSLVVCDDVPVPPLSRWTDRLERTLSVPLWRVDCACVVPLPLGPERPERAYRFRSATKRLRSDRLVRSWEDRTPACSSLPTLPFAPVALREDWGALIATCDIDHSIGPVVDTPPGSRAGYRRWRSFVATGVSRYARDRNDPLRHGVSRMSAYLHFGQVSPFRLARQIAVKGGKGAEKYLDELLTWRELAWHWCAGTDAPESLDVLPDWALETLAAHQADPRELLDWERLARGQTGDALWDACQQSLLRHGELHNNVRMTWGKALPLWTAGPDQALSMLLDLNHRYALDGRDPASLGGLLWCLGLFDRPFAPEAPVLGAVRPRSTRQHARRLDVAAYRSHVSRPFCTPVPRVAVVGAGVSGIAAARALADAGVDVVVFERDDTVGGRLGRPGPDLGAQYLTAKHPVFARRVRSWVCRGWLRPWQGRVVRVEADGSRVDVPARGTRYLGAPDMGRWLREVARDVVVRTHVDIAALRGEPGAWELGTGEVFDAVLVAHPDASLLAAAPALQAQLRERVAAAGPCVALAVQLDQEVAVDFAALQLPHDPVLAWARRMEGPEPVWVLQSQPEAGVEVTDGALLGAFASALGAPVRLVEVQRRMWPVARAQRAEGPRCGWDADVGLGACGDVWVGPRIEAAWLSGEALAGRVLSTLAERAWKEPGAAQTGWSHEAAGEAVSA